MTEENLIIRRSKRSTAGNRMQAALAEFALKDLYKEEDSEEDRDFIVETYDEDVFESDFRSSTDEEGPAEDHDIADHEKKPARKAARSKFERATATAQTRQTRQKTTFDPSTMVQGPSTSTAGNKRKRRVSLALDVDAYSGDIIADHVSVDPESKRSRRRSTIQNTTATVKRHLRSETKNASQPRTTFRRHREANPGPITRSRTRH